MAYTVISFNLRNIYDSARLNRDWKAVAEIIRNERADIVAVQEIFSETPMRILCQRLNAGLLSNWRFRPVSRTTCGNSRGEGYAFLWNAKRVDLAPIIKVTADGFQSYGYHEPEIRTEWSRSIMRPPCVARFVPVGWCVPFIELRVITTHIIFRENKYLREKGNGLGDTDLRREEYRALSARLFPRVAKDRQDGRFRPAYTFIVGDYNLSQSECTAIDLECQAESGLMTTRQNLGSTIYPGDDQNPGGYTTHDYDHATCSEHEIPYVQIVERINAPDIYYKHDFKAYEEHVSDHAPIKMLFDVRSVNPEVFQCYIQNKEAYDEH